MYLCWENNTICFKLGQNILTQNFMHKKRWVEERFQGIFEKWNDLKNNFFLQ